MKAVGLNPKSKYVEEGLKNRAAFDQVMAHRGQDIQSDKKIARRAGIGIFCSRQNGKLTITLLPWHSTVIIDEATARMTRYTTALDEYARKPRKDKIPPEWIKVTDQF